MIVFPRLLLSLGFMHCLFAVMPAPAEEEPMAFQMNCKACHLIDQQLVGPSLVEIAKIYRDKPEEFVKWCYSPEKKRPKLTEMPAMAHVPREDLLVIFDYIQKATVGVKEKAASNADPYGTHPHKTRRPRVQRMFLPNTGPASIYLALPGEPKTNVIWDADLCRLRYISKGEIDDWPYLKGNGSSLATVRNIAYSEESHVLSNKASSVKPEFHGYRLDSNGFPTFLYKIGDLEIRESITGSSGLIDRAYLINGDFSQLNIKLPGKGGHHPTMAEAPQTNGKATTFVLTHHIK